MTVPLTGNQSFFQRLGEIITSIISVNNFRGTTLPSQFVNLQASYASSDQSTVDGIYSNLFSAQGSMSAANSYLAALANSTAVRMVNDDIGLPYNSPIQIGDAITYINNQMKATSQTIQACHVSGSVTPYVSNYGNGVVVFGRRRQDGLINENIFQENITALVTADSYTNGLASGQEVLTFTGTPSVSDRLSFLFPVGSQCGVSLTCVSPSISQGSGYQNYLNNGTFESWSSNVPSGWVVNVGTPGTTVNQSSSVFFDGANSLNFAGNGTELTEVYQLFNSSSGTTSRLYPLTQYCVNLFIRVDSTPPSGVLEIALTDGSGLITSDYSNNQNVISKNLNTVSTSWVNVSAMFRTPRLLPSVLRLRVRLSTAMPAGKNLYIDRAAFAQPTQLYTGGPFVAAFSGNTNFVNGDYLTVAVTNDYAGVIQSYANRVFDMRSLNLLLNSSDSPTILDSTYVTQTRQTPVEP